MSIGPLQLLIVLLIIVLIFGTKKLRNMGGDLGGAIKNFKKSVKDESQPKESEPEDAKSEETPPKE